MLPQLPTERRSQAKGNNYVAPCYHVARNPRNSAYVSGTHSPLAALYYSCCGLVDSEYESILANTRMWLHPDAIDSRTANLTGWPKQGRNNFLHSDECLFLDYIELGETTNKSPSALLAPNMNNYPLLLHVL